MIRVLIADDHAVTRHGIRAILESDDRFTVVGEVADGESLLDAAATLLPDVSVVDLTMPVLDGISVLRAWRTRGLSGTVVILSLRSDGEAVMQALEAGARGYILKSDEPMLIRSAVAAAHTGGMFLSPEVTTVVVSGAMEQSQPEPEVRLTRREREVLQLVAEGLEAKEAASRLGIKHKTVLAVRLRLMRKLDVHSVAGLTRYAIRRGITPLEAQTPRELRPTMPQSS
jgi:two-component system NarL family response regulator